MRAALNVTVMAVVDLDVTAGSAVCRSSVTTHTGALRNGLAKVIVQAVGDALPVLMIEAKSVELASTLGLVPQEDTVGAVPLDTTCP